MEQSRERAEEMAPPAEERAPAAPASALARFQSAMGNRAFGALVAREYTPSPPVELPAWHASEEEGHEGLEHEPIELDQPSAQPAGGGATKGNNFTRPAPTDLNQSFSDGNAAVDHINGKNFIGEANCQFELSAGDISMTGKKGAYTASVPVWWSTSAASSMQVWNPTWPNMTDPEKQAVADMRAALLAHEQGHFDNAEKTVKGWTRISATGATEQAAASALQAKAPTVQQDWQDKLKAADEAYDKKTAHGGNQAAVGGTNVKLTLPPKAAAPTPPQTP